MLAESESDQKPWGSLELGLCRLARVEIANAGPFLNKAELESNGYWLNAAAGGR